MKTSSDAHVHRLDGATMGTRYSVTYVTHSPVPDAGLAERVFGAVDAVDRQMSNWKDASDLSRFNRAPVGEWVDMPADLAYVVEAGLKVAGLSDGAFDITVGPVLALWGFGPGAASGLPDAAAMAAARANCGTDRIDLRQSPPALRKTAPVTIDLSGIAKGFGVDKIVAVLEAEGIVDYLAEIDGEIRLSGQKGADKWTVALEAPIAGRREAFDILEPPACAIATSGDYRKFRSQGDKTFSHTIDPRATAPLDGQIGSVTVIAPSCMMADAWATALMVKGPTDGVALAQSLGIAARFLIREAGQIRDEMTGDFVTYLGDLA